MEKNKKVKMSPAARKLAKEMGINVGEIEGSSSVIRSKDLLGQQEKQFLEETLDELNFAVGNTKDLLSKRYDDILYEERKTQSYLSWKEAKDTQTAQRTSWLIAHDLEKANAARKVKQAQAKSVWEAEKNIQTRKRIGYFSALADEKRQEKARVSQKAWAAAKAEQTAARREYLAAVAEEKRAEKAKAAQKAWVAAKAEQTAVRREYLAAVAEEKRAEKAKASQKAWAAAKAEQTAARREYLATVTEAKRAQKARAAQKAWAKAKAEMDAQTADYFRTIEDAKIDALWKERIAQAKLTWEDLKKEGDQKIEEFMDAYDTRKFEEAYDDYIQSLDEYNQVSVGKIEFEIDDIEEDIEESEVPLNEAITKYVAQATAKALIDLECPIYENGIMNVISLVGEKPIKTVKDAHEGNYLDLCFEDAIYFSKDVKVRVWDLSACGLESFFASQGGINVYINVEDDEVDLDVAIDTKVMMDLEALIFMMRMKEYLVK